MTGFNQTLSWLPEPLRHEVTQYWETFQASSQTVGLELPTGAILEPLTRVWACSEFVARACIRAPGLLAELLASGDLSTCYAPGDLANRLEHTLADAANEEQLSVGLRRFRRREMVRIAWRDLGGLAKLTETLGDLTDLAEVAVSAALERLYAWQCQQRYGAPRDAEGQPQQLVVLGMGKLGGRELNFSSDIDLILTYPAQGQTDGPRVISNEEFFRRLGQRLSKVLAEITAEGFVFRVDLRLRPFGDSGPVALSFAAFEDYYQNHGRDWERYAMIKARVIAGDRKAGERLLIALRPFVYRRYLDYNAFEALRSMKTLIAQEVERKGMQRNIKLGPGGIREIEFIGQVFQLIYGGREPALQERGILSVLNTLAMSGRLPEMAITELKEAYVFLRRVENRLQAWADRQTHDLPEEERAKARLAYAMDYPNWRAFAQELTRHIEQVSQHFAHVFGDGAEAPSGTGNVDWAELWRDNPDEESAVHLLTEQNFEDPASAWNRLWALRNSFSYRTMSPRGRARLDTLIPNVLEAAATMPQPTATLERILNLLEAVARRSVYLALLADHPQALAQLVKLCAASGWIARHLSRYPLLLDDLLNPATLYAPLDRSQLALELDQQLQRAPDDEEEQLNALRYFKQAQVLRVAAADVSGAMPLMIVSDHLTEIAETLLRKVLERAWIHLTPRFGAPRCKVEGVERDAQFAIVAYGKLGGIELNYGSDLDLVFLHDSAGDQQSTSGPRQIDNAAFFAKLLQRILHLLTARTGAGDLYEVDTRLRPSGRAGLLVSSFEAFAEYQRSQAWTWEHQALLRTRVVAGPTALAERFAAIRQEILQRERDPVALRQEVRDMRERMRTELDASTNEGFDLKQGRGGIADIEFMVQYAVLANACRCPDLLIFTDNIRQIDGLERFGALSIADAAWLRHAYRVLRRRIHQLKLQEQPALILPDDMSREREGVVRIWRRLMEIH
ncbi:MAG: bifunctional [glutamate--ammonia ligase]-adenylyl-L-tyrosine phosphorylase/[glutamate--ammonia-ligase] adenylyltransferase [Candidatus Competibacteraceae bacterium]|nr:bifunctional [glutamate--ammonia ligase]-adenylyl-L-tyrosine phosphorylase/[glutamate--ammonia-ligase] adenylyltransferase [Candidatus Competibacteraceae bacterium]MCP5126433.1 bifunctional [glutamate--ammonia ligase]-adenylyl-L-tyrosine phosphorylase/[glutamate--ammonia-ligase] adenylyltransferase [Gammaproteobacteria bacterium]HRX71381.1 bifunctional [glutamate--ammonia ligase]-adenylyl-L-tyrosine phosphorylase/[glutamate--ammonia-ligase] adenylyltransferase [Candidatus Competibacteraceae ba